MQLCYNTFLNFHISMSTLYGFTCQQKFLIRVLKLGLEKSQILHVLVLGFWLTKVCCQVQAFGQFLLIKKLK